LNFSIICRRRNKKTN